MTKSAPKMASMILERMQFDASFVGIAIALGKCIFENLLQHPGGSAVSVERNFVRILEAERSQIVEPHDVVRVGVGVQDCVDEAQIFAECLLAKIGSGINQHRSFVVALAKLDENRGTHAGIPGIGRGADRAAATERGDAHGSAAA